MNTIAPFAILSNSVYSLDALSETSIVCRFIAPPAEKRGYTNVIELTGGGGTTVTLVATGVPEPSFLLLIALCYFAIRKKILNPK